MSPIRKQSKLHENQYRLKPFWPTTWSLCTTVPKLSLQTRYILLRVSFILAYFIAICIVRIITDGGTKCQKLPLPSPWPLFCIDLALCSSVCYYLHYLLHYYFNIHGHITDWIVHQVPSVSHHWEYSSSVSISWPVGHTVLVFLVVSLCLACYVVLLMAGLSENFAGTLNNYYYLILRGFGNHLTFRKNKI